ncbi:methyltransferase domain-containing protein [Saccharibacillus brassicae]|uniref:Class I SAM-dependent methyltransferase n=1 Tax=Saccharibacillus brassicae TaxID=2583377 RepID=A0A4Y6URY5_SACBS|nr:methyltransferase domain-containing protein [Saccharibacillus brassicae]QDH20432.1 class I SAM-dependent methyltransferase [Saccharibacillus brassicae]
MQIDPKKVKEFYENQETIWPSKDKWHQFTKESIEKYLQFKYKNIKTLRTTHTILNIGSGGSNYGLSNDMHHVDLTEKFISKYKNFTVANAEELPFKTQSFESAICVGSVINYCDAAKCIEEIARVLKSNSYFFLEFENSWSMEFSNSNAHKQMAAVVKTRYFDEEHMLWVYSPQHIISLLNVYGFEIKHIKHFHLVSSLIYKFTKNENLSSFFSLLDPVMSKFPFLKKRSHNVILTCVKN